MGKKKEAPASVETLAKETLKAKRVIEKEDSREERKKSKAEKNAKLEVVKEEIVEEPKKKKEKKVEAKEEEPEPKEKKKEKKSKVKEEPIEEAVAKKDKKSKVKEEPVEEEPVVTKEKKQKKRTAEETVEEAPVAKKEKKEKKDSKGKKAAEEVPSEPPASRPDQGSNPEADTNNKGSSVGRAFQRVKAEEWLGKKGAIDNRYEATFGDQGWGYKAQQVLGQVRGKDFRHEKTKKKRGSYLGGAIDPNATFSTKFDSDDE